LKINYFCAENNDKNIYSCEKLHKKLLPPEPPFLIQICTKSFVGWGFAPDPTGGAYSAPPDPLAVFGLLLGEGPHDPSAWGPQCLNPAQTDINKLYKVLSNNLK